MRDRYEVIVGNIGKVYEGSQLVDAQHNFNVYVHQSVNVPGSRAYGEDVTLFENGEPIREHSGHLTADQDI